MSWFRNKIKGDFAESICENHFKAIGYEVDHTGLENSLESFSRQKFQSNTLNSITEKIYSQYRFTPDLLISRLNANNQQESFFIEVKYRVDVIDFQLLENELFWQYRHIIWNNNVSSILSTNEIALWVNNNEFDPNSNDMSSALIKVKQTRAQYQNLPVIFYLVVKNKSINEEYIYLNLPIFARWYNINDNIFLGQTLSYNMYKSTNASYSNFQDAYNQEIKLALDDIFQ